MAFLVAPDAHVHAHDVGALDLWMSSSSAGLTKEFDRSKRRGGRPGTTDAANPFNRMADDLVRELYAKGKQYTVFHNELARQSAAHCPRVARCALWPCVRCPA